MLEIIKNCPSCGTLLTRKGPNLFCTSTICKSKNMKIVENYAYKMNIMGLGPKTIERLNIDSIQDLYKLTETKIKSIIGEKLGDKLFLEIEKTKKTSLGKFLAACSIPLIGKVAGTKLNYSSLEELKNNVGDTLGTRATENLIKWINKNKYLVESLPVSFSIENNNVNKTMFKVCISGKIKGYTKLKIKEILSTHNVEVKDSVTKDLDFLITEENNTNKVNKAIQYDIPIITLDKFLEETLNVKME